ncbi:hypothetical protein SKAU_G00248710 [Synaphobranchus kaupii]|uniref:L1 transposable element RRM domain-containing protein n=1 Tax=Synaphobranchus kaupii TaxID=118154 RepID=A0A9Q1F2I8_SYNKA|nr:hypothetical protein SKAU_G00248710 [Synaphobranchus kaupii]
MRAIQNEIRALRSDFKSDLGEFRLSLRDDMRKDLNEFRGEINRKLKETTDDLQTTKARVTETEQRIAEIEEWDGAASDALIQALEKQEVLQAKLTDLEACSRRNNLRIYGVPEGSEGNDLPEFVTRLIKSELGPQIDVVDLGIQRCHRELAPKPPRDAPPRSLVLCFLEFRVKEQVLHTAWKNKEVCYQGKRIFFDRDYLPETLKKRKAYAEGGILKELKAKGIRFQTPYPAKLRVFFESGTQIYECAAEAAKDLKKKGFSLENVKGPDSTQSKQRRLATWEKAGADRRRQPVDQERIRERLRSFRRALAKKPAAKKSPKKVKKPVTPKAKKSPKKAKKPAKSPKTAKKPAAAAAKKATKSPRKAKPAKPKVSKAKAGKPKKAVPKKK